MRRALLGSTAYAALVMLLTGAVMLSQASCKKRAPTPARPSNAAPAEVEANRDELHVNRDRYLVTTPDGVSKFTAQYEEASRAMARHDVKTARAIYQRILAAEPNEAEPHVGLGSCAMEERDLETAQAEYERALAKRPGHGAAHVGLGSLFYDRREYVRAVDHYEAAIKTRQDDPDAHFGAAIAYDQLGNRERARVHARTFLTLAPDSQLAPHARELLR